MTSPEQLQQFFVVMEVYGAGTEMSLQSAEEDSLKNLRQKALNVLTVACNKMDKKTEFIRTYL